MPGKLYYDHWIRLITNILMLLQYLKCLKITPFFVYIRCVFECQEILRCINVIEGICYVMNAMENWITARFVECHLGKPDRSSQKRYQEYKVNFQKSNIKLIIIVFGCTRRLRLLFLNFRFLPNFLVLVDSMIKDARLKWWKHLLMYTSEFALLD